MPKPKIEILRFSEDNLAFALSNDFISAERVKSKTHFIYLFDYLKNGSGLNVNTIVIEYDYISKSYLSDYSTYYSLCFKDYPRKTKRIHFFGIQFTKRKFDYSISSNSVSDKELWNSYLGFVVAKPLPDAIIGPTLLKMYDRTPTDHRKYIATKNYKIHLFGKELTLDSLIYQEQDTVLSACATTALWCAFHKTSELFHTPEPSPNEITKNAGNLFFNSGRTFPNHGLDVYQICKAIENVGLVTELRNKNIFLNDIDTVKAFVYGYLKLGLPVLLGIKIDGIGDHLITVSGYKEIKAISRFSQTISLKSHFIERFYAHDDQIGPFSRIGFNGNKILTSWWLKDDVQNKLEATVSSVFVPLHPKIRITFEEVYKKINNFDKFLYLIFDTLNTKIELVWDIYLDFSESLKSEIKNNPTIRKFKKREILTKQMPRFIWRSICIIDDKYVVEIIFDATDIGRGFFIHDIIFYDDVFESFLKSILSLTNISNLFKKINGSELYSFLRKKLK